MTNTAAKPTRSADKSAPRPATDDASPQPIRLAVLLFTLVGGLLFIDALLAVAWWPSPRLPNGNADSPVSAYVLELAHGQSAWAAGANLLAAASAGLAALWLSRNHRWARMVALTLVSTVGLYRLTIVFNLLIQAAGDGPWPSWIPGVRLLLSIVILPCLAGAAAFVLNRGLTRTDRHRALIGVDAGPAPRLISAGSYLLVLYGLLWFALAILGYLSFGLWVERGGPGMDGFDARLDFAETLVSGTVGFLGGMVLLTIGLVMWFRPPRAIFWRIAVGAATVQLSLSSAVFLWESVLDFSVITELPTPTIHVVSYLLDGLAGGQLLLLAAALALLWHPKVAGFYRSRR